MIAAYMLTLFFFSLLKETALACSVGAANELLLHQYSIDFRVLLIHRHLLNELLIICEGDCKGSTYTYADKFPCQRICSLRSSCDILLPIRHAFILRAR